MSAQDTVVAPNDEQRHAATRDAQWSESYYLNFFDRASGVGGFARLSFAPTRNEVEGLLCIYRPEGGIGIAHITDVLPEPPAIRAGALVFECLEPLQQWCIQYDGEVALFDDPSQVPASRHPDAVVPRTTRVLLDLIVDGTHAPYVYPPYKRSKDGPPRVDRGTPPFGRRVRSALRRPREILSALNMRQNRHYEQSLRVSGSVVIGASRHEIRGTGHRDHSWGPRDWSAAHCWRWLSGQLDDFAFNAMFLTIAGTHVTNGFVWTNGACVPVDALALETTFDHTGLAARSVRLRLTAGGTHYDIEGDVSVNVPLPIDGPGFSTMYTVGRTHYRCGSRSGYGVAEFLERLDP